VQGELGDNNELDYGQPTKIKSRERKRYFYKIRPKMKIFSDEFIGFLKQTLICSWKGHRKGGWVEVYWAPAHSIGYQSRFCEVCHKELETTGEKGAKN